MSDPRFTALRSDPRYRLLSRKESKAAADPRFKRLLTDEDFHNKAKVDRHGRRLQRKQPSLRDNRAPRLEAQRPLGRTTDRNPVKDGEKEDEDSSEDEGSQDDRSRSAERDTMREGFLESSSEEDSDSDTGSESETELELAEATAGHEQNESIPMGEVSRRIAAVNLDWDNIRASDIMAVAQSFVLSGGKLESVHIYPSEFGKQRLQREELEGPPKEIFASTKKSTSKSESGFSSGDDSSDEHEDNSEDDDDDDDDDDEDEKIKQQLLNGQADEGAEFDTAKLRQYQLERLRYYYAVLTCSSSAVAKSIYDNLDGREYLTSANFFDLRFIPDETDFSSDEPREACTKLPETYKPNDFRTEALTHSKVRLTWDDDDTTRKEVQKRAFSRAEVDENDLKAYIGSDSSDAESVSSRKSSTTPEERKARKAEEKRRLMREKLGLGVEFNTGHKNADRPVGEMEITFTSGLSKGTHGDGIFENEPQDEESTRARYIRKEKERKQKRKEKSKATRQGGTTGDVKTTEGDEVKEDLDGNTAEPDLGFDDPFFTNPEAPAVAEKNARKEARQRKREEKAAAAAEEASKRAELELLMADDKGDQTRHFDMKEIEKAEQRKVKKGKKYGKRKPNDESAVETDNFNVDTSDPRFKGLFDSHEFAIDPTNPRFKGTQGMRTLLEEGRKRKNLGIETSEQPDRSKVSKKAKNADRDGSRDGELDGLVSRLKKSSRAR